MNIIIKSYYVNRYMDYNNIKKIRQCKGRFHFPKQYIILPHLYHMDKFNF